MGGCLSGSHVDTTRLSRANHSRSSSGDSPTVEPVSRTVLTATRTSTMHLSTVVLPPIGVFTDKTPQRQTVCSPEPSSHEEVLSRARSPDPRSAWSDTIEFKEIQLIKEVGSGAFGTVWLGKLWGQEVAVKRFRIEKDNVRKLLDHEVSIMAKARHPNIVEYLGHCHEPELCLITEYVHNGSLQHLLEDSNTTRLSLHRYLKIAIGIARGLTWLHHKHTIHRDLKPSNILLDSHESVKICDFGLSHFKRRKDKPNLYGRAGTFMFMAPEVLSSREYGLASDIYSFGMILCQMLTGRRPFDTVVGGCDDSSDSLLETMVRRGVRPVLPDEQPHVERHPPLVDLEQIPPQLTELVKKCWHSDPALRPSADTVLRTLEDIANATDLRMQDVQQQINELPSRLKSYFTDKATREQELEHALKMSLEAAAQRDRTIKSLTDQLREQQWRVAELRQRVGGQPGVPRKVLIPRQQTMPVGTAGRRRKATHRRRSSPQAPSTVRAPVVDLPKLDSGHPRSRTNTGSSGGSTDSTHAARRVPPRPSSRGSDHYSDRVSGASDAQMLPMGRSGFSWGFNANPYVYPSRQRQVVAPSGSSSRGSDHRPTAPTGRSPYLTVEPLTNSGRMDLSHRSASHTAPAPAESSSSSSASRRRPPKTAVPFLRSQSLPRGRLLLHSPDSPNFSRPGLRARRVKSWVGSPGSVDDGPPRSRGSSIDLSSPSWQQPRKPSHSGPASQVFLIDEAAQRHRERTPVSAVKPSRQSRPTLRSLLSAPVASSLPMQAASAHAMKPQSNVLTTPLKPSSPGAGAVCHPMQLASPWSAHSPSLGSS